MIRERMWTSRGFTIVELLIVIVVIAILAAITIVVYNGIQNQAKVASAQSSASQTAKKLLTYAVQNSDNYPASLATAGILDSGGITYQYSVNNSTTPKTFCVTVTVQNVSYWISNANSTPTSGGCDGHGVGGVAAITNLIVVSSLEDGNPAGFSGASWLTGTGITPVTPTVPSDGGYVGSRYRRWSLSGMNTTQASAALGNYLNVEAGSSLWVSFYARSSTPSSFGVASYPNSGLDGGGTTLTQTYGPIASMVPGVWQRVVHNYIVPSDGSVLSIRPAIRVSLGTTSAGQNIDIDALMVTAGPTIYNFADGNSPGWAWNGTPNNSTSVGPPL